MNAQTENWKDKYLLALNEVDDLERTWRRQVRALAGAIRTLIGPQASDNPPVSDYLNALERAESTAEDFSHALDALCRLDLPASISSPAADAGSADGFIRLLESLPLNSEQKVSVKDLAESWQRVSHPLDERVAQCSALLLTFVKPAPAADALGTLFDLVDRIGVPPKTQEKLSELTSELEHETPSVSVNDVAQALTDGYLDLQQELNGLNGFMLDISERLSSLFQELPKLSGDRVSSTADRDALQNSFSSTISAMQRDMDGAAGVDELKQAIAVQLDSLDTELTHFLQAEKTRVTEAERRAEALDRDLDRLRSDAVDLRERLHEAERQSMRDPLTGLPNRIAYQERINAEYHRWSRHAHPLSLVLFDIDRFKTVNDSFGHLAGDRMLKIVSTMLAERLREQDFLARYGGEEFVLIVPDTDAEGAMALAESLRATIENCRVQHGEQPVVMTVSGGVADFREGDTIETVFARADGALYQAKEEGRNQCRFAE